MLEPRITLALVAVATLVSDAAWPAPRARRANPTACPVVDSGAVYLGPLHKPPADRAPTPRLPSGGRAVLEYIVSASGTVDSSGMQVVSATDSTAAAEARRAAATRRFLPAEAEPGCPVRVIVQGPFGLSP